MHIPLECPEERLRQLQEEKTWEGLQHLLPGVRQIYHRLGIFELCSRKRALGLRPSHIRVGGYSIATGTRLRYHSSDIVRPVS